MSDTTIQPSGVTRVSLSSLDVSFGQLVLFFVKAGLAAIPAILILMLTVGVVGAVLRGIFRIGFWGMHGGWYH
ncbi:MAG: hypothetical protein NTZ14_08015 [Hyphomicrobiales bacterium]|nr:hypothetical protein [Hyphomicrobiales bacterium]